MILYLINIIQLLTISKVIIIFGKFNEINNNFCLFIVRIILISELKVYVNNLKDIL